MNNAEKIKEITTRYREISQILQEKTLFLDDFPISSENGKYQQSQFIGKVKFDNRELDEKDQWIDRLTVTSFFELFYKAVDLKPSEISTYITGLYFWYGVNDTLPKKFEVIYQPVCLKYDVQPNSNFTIILKGEYYSSKNEFQTPLDEKTVETLKWNYKQFVKIRHDGQINHTDIITDHPIEKENDALASFFSFQEIFMLASDNQLDKYDYLDIRNNIKICDNCTQKSKHGILLIDPKDVGKIAKAVPDFNGKYANRAYLCPPDCGSFSMPVL